MQGYSCFGVDGISLRLIGIRRSRMPVTAAEADIILFRRNTTCMISRVVAVALQRNEFTVHKCFLHTADGIETVLIYCAFFRPRTSVLFVQFIVRTAIYILRFGSNKLVPIAKHGIVVVCLWIRSCPPVSTTTILFYIKPFHALFQTGLVVRINGSRSDIFTAIAVIHVREEIGMVFRLILFFLMEPASMNIVEGGIRY